MVPSGWGDWLSIGLHLSYSSAHGMHCRVASLTSALGERKDRLRRTCICSHASRSPTELPAVCSDHFAREQSIISSEYCPCSRITSHSPNGVLPCLLIKINFTSLRDAAYLSQASCWQPYCDTYARSTWVVSANKGKPLCRSLGSEE